MKRTDLRKSLQKIKSKLHTASLNPSYDTPLNCETSFNICQCKDSSGEVKMLYPTFKEAKEVAMYLQSNLKIYPCPYEKGWHLTKG